MILKHILPRPKLKARPVYEAIVAAARRPELYASYGVADSLDGRFEMISLHMYLVLDRLRGDAADDFRQALTDEFFADMDRSLREMGVGDLSVGKKVRKMAEVFFGRVQAYNAASGDSKKMADALARNVYAGSARDGDVERLLDYIGTVRSKLSDAVTADIVAGKPGVL
jgi:cytochrome b pre-mRNA-processing protein 3